MKLRIFVPAGGDGVTARLQYCAPRLVVYPDDEKVPGWADVPTVYEDPDDEVVECPVQLGGAPHVTDDRMCVVCMGEGHGRKGDIERRLRALQGVEAK